MSKTYISEPFLDYREKKSLLLSFKRNEISTFGKSVRIFEKKASKITEAKYNLALNSGSAGLLIAFKSIGINKNDIVLTQSYTFIATISSILHTGATPWVFDLNYKDFNLDISKIERQIKLQCIKKGNYYYHKKSKKRIFAICPVFSFSIIPNLKEINRFAKKFNLKIIFDAACSFGAKYKNFSVTKFADISIFSFNGNKSLTTGAGGLLSTNNKTFFSRAEKLSQNGKNIKDSYTYDVIGHNYKMSNLHASIGISQLKKFQEIKFRKNKVRQIYEKAFDKNNITILPKIKNSNYILWINCIITKNKNYTKKIILLLNNLRIESKLFWKPMHKQKSIKNKLLIDKNLKFTDFIWERIVTLPSSPNLKPSVQAKIISEINKIWKKK